MAIRRLAPPRWSYKSVLLFSSVALFLVTVVAYHQRVSGSPTAASSWSRVVRVPKGGEALRVRGVVANGTLGFQSIYALSQGTKWRVQGLQAAAKLTGLDISMPPNPRVNPEELAAFNKIGLPGLGNGSATAWLAHLNLLRRVIENGDETALILEDDADWDVALKVQMQMVSDGVRSLCEANPPLFPPNHLHRHTNNNNNDNNPPPPPPPPPPHTSSTTNNPPSSPFPPPTPNPYSTCWDILWLGHCGENLSTDVPTWRHPAPPTFRMWRDRTTVPRDSYSGFAHNSIMTLPEGMRAALVSRGPVCTFGYAVTGRAARRLLEVAGVGDDQAYDVKLSRLCQVGVLRCFSVVPEVIHEYRPPAGVDGVTTSEVNAANGQGEGAGDGDGWGMGSTLNVVESARCKALFKGERCFPGRVEE